MTQLQTPPGPSSQVPAAARPGGRVLAGLAMTAMVVAALLVGMWWGGQRETGDVASGDVRSVEEVVALGPDAVVEEYVERRISGRVTDTLELMTEDAADEQRDFFAGLAVWNLRGVLREPCERLVTDDPSEHRFECILLETNDFHLAGGISSWTAVVELTIDGPGLISGHSVSLDEHQSFDERHVVSPFNTAFITWLRNSHPDLAAEFLSPGPAQIFSPPMTGAFNAVKAEIALEYVDEFVAQSDLYPLIDGH